MIDQRDVFAQVFENIDNNNCLYSSTISKRKIFHRLFIGVNGHLSQQMTPNTES